MLNYYSKEDLLKPFLEDNIILINNNKWEEIYALLNSKDRFLRWGLSNALIGWFTEMMLSCDINPLEYMNYVPQNFLNSVDLTKATYLKIPGHFIIPDHIKKIEFNAFYNVEGLSDLILPENIEEIEDHSLPINGQTLNLHIKDIEKFLKLNLNLKNIKIINNGNVIELPKSKPHHYNSWEDISKRYNNAKYYIYESVWNKWNENYINDEWEWAEIIKTIDDSNKLLKIKE